MRDAPVLILAYNRADKARRLVDALRSQAPRRVLVSIDGPKPGDAEDAARVAAVAAEVGRIDWTEPEVLARESNVGLRAAVAGAVTWALDTYGQTIVIEDDAIPGPDWVPYATAMLERHRDEERIAHISGYDVVPPARRGVPTQGSRLTRFPESFAWATWDRAWAAYDDSLAWGLGAPLAELIEVTGSRAAALRWRQHFTDAASGRISSWAYRWVASMWSRRWLSLSPNGNLVAYAGYDHGTHAGVLSPPWEEQPIWSGGLDALLATREPELDEVADAYVGGKVFGGTWWGVVRGAAISVVLGVRRRLRASRARRASSR